MKKIKYFDNCKQEYLISLGLLCPDGRTYTKNYYILNKKWHKLRKKYDLNFIPKKVSKLMTAKFQKLIIYFEKFDNVIDMNIDIQKFYVKNNKLQKKKYNSEKKKFLLPLINLFKYSIKNNEQISFYSDIPDFSEKIGQFFIDNANKLEINSCFYCESSFVGIFELETETRRTFELDHFFPKEQYPLFAISLYNFVPSCTICNCRIKGSSYFKDFYKLSKKLNSKDIGELRFLSPSSSDYDFYSHTKFNITPCCPPNNIEWKYTNDINMYELSIDSDDSTPYKKFINAFKLNERYNSTSIKLHALYLYQLKRNNPDEHIHEIARILSEAGFTTSVQEIKNKLFHLDEKKSLLKKLETDILRD